VIGLHRRRRGRCFTPGGGAADGVRVRVFDTRPRFIPPAGYHPGGFCSDGLRSPPPAWVYRLPDFRRSAIASRKTSELHAQSPRSSHRFEQWLPTALQRSDGGSMRLVVRAWDRFFCGAGAP
jgi:hypothetical protein